MEALGLGDARAIGGITGALARWAPKKGVALPYRVDEDAEGRRWTWVRD